MPDSSNGDANSQKNPWLRRLAFLTAIIAAVGTFVGTTTDTFDKIKPAIHTVVGWWSGKSSEADPAYQVILIDILKAANGEPLDSIPHSAMLQPISEKTLAILLKNNPRELVLYTAIDSLKLKSGDRMLAYYNYPEDDRSESGVDCPKMIAGPLTSPHGVVRLEC
jgi:hypothetical protein